LKDTSVDGRIMLKYILKGQSVSVWAGFCHLGIRSSELGNELSDSIRAENFLLI
jgi:hypothetical protein